MRLVKDTMMFYILNYTKSTHTKTAIFAYALIQSLKLFGQSFQEPLLVLALFHFWRFRSNSVARVITTWVSFSRYQLIQKVCIKLDLEPLKANASNVLKPDENSLGKDCSLAFIKKKNGHISKKGFCFLILQALTVLITANSVSKIVWNYISRYTSSVFLLRTK